MGTLEVVLVTTVSQMPLVRAGKTPFLFPGNLLLRGHIIGKNPYVSTLTNINLGGTLYVREIVTAAKSNSAT